MRRMRSSYINSLAARMPLDCGFVFFSSVERYQWLKLTLNEQDTSLKEVNGSLHTI